MPAVTPADVQNLPSRRYRASGSTSSPGCSRARRSLARPVGADGPTFEQPGCGQRERPVHTLATRRAEPARRRIPATTSPSASSAYTPPPPTTSKRVDRPAHAGQRLIGEDRQAALRPHRTGLGRRDQEAVAGIGPALGAEQLVGPGEDLVGTGQVQGLTARVDDEDDTAVRHGTSIPGIGDGVNDMLPTVSAIGQPGSAAASGQARVLPSRSSTTRVPAHLSHMVSW